MVGFLKTNFISKNFIESTQAVCYDTRGISKLNFNGSTEIK